MNERLNCAIWFWSNFFHGVGTVEPPWFGVEARLGCFMRVSDFTIFQYIYIYPRHPGSIVTLVPHLLAEYLGSYRFCNYSRSITLIHGKHFDPFFHTALLFALTFRAFALHFKESNLTRELRINDLSMILLLVYFIANFFAHPMASSSMNVCSNRGLSPQKC